MFVQINFIFSDNLHILCMFDILLLSEQLEDTKQLSKISTMHISLALRGMTVFYVQL